MQKFIKQLHFIDKKFVRVIINPYICIIKNEVITIKRYMIMATKKMSDKVKGSLIAQIMSEMKSVAILQNKPFDEGIFFDLIFMSDKELLKVSRLCGIK